jgi:hypothetical protein
LFDLLRKLYPDFGFEPENTYVFIETSDLVFAEYEMASSHHFFLKLSTGDISENLSFLRLPFGERDVSRYLMGGWNH